MTGLRLWTLADHDDVAALPHWTDPGVFEVAAGVYRIPLPLPQDGLRAVNVYVVRTGERIVVVDSGWDVPEARTLLRAAVAELGIGLEQVDRFLITHAHRDHYEHSMSIRREFGTHVALGAGEETGLRTVRQPDYTPFQNQHARLLALGASVEAAAYRSRAENLRIDLAGHGLPDEWLSEGVLDLDGRILDVVETPGHTAGHVVFHDRAAGLLFAGDHVLPTITPSIGYEPVPVPNPLGDFLGSLRTVRARPDALLLPAHGQIAPSVHARVDELLDHHGHRLDATERAVRGGSSTGREVAAELSWTRHGHPLSSLDDLNTMLAIFETGAHLDLLVVQGRLAVTVGDDGVRYYR